MSENPILEDSSGIPEEEEEKKPDNPKVNKKKKSIKIKKKIKGKRSNSLERKKKASITIKKHKSSGDEDDDTNISFKETNNKPIIKNNSKNKKGQNNTKKDRNEDKIKDKDEEEKEKDEEEEKDKNKESDEVKEKDKESDEEKEKDDDDEKDKNKENDEVKEKDKNEDSDKNKESNEDEDKESDKDKEKESDEVEEKKSTKKVKSKKSIIRKIRGNSVKPKSKKKKEKANNKQTKKKEEKSNEDDNSYSDDLDDISNKQQEEEIKERLNEVGNSYSDDLDDSNDSNDSDDEQTIKRFIYPELQQIKFDYKNVKKPAENAFYAFFGNHLRFFITFAYFKTYHVNESVLETKKESNNDQEEKESSPIQKYEIVKNEIENNEKYAISNIEINISSFVDCLSDQYKFLLENQKFDFSSGSLDDIIVNYVKFMRLFIGNYIYSGKIYNETSIQKAIIDDLEDSQEIPRMVIIKVQNDDGIKREISIERESKATYEYQLAWLIAEEGTFLQDDSCNLFYFQNGECKAKDELDLSLVNQPFFACFSKK